MPRRTGTIREYAEKLLTEVSFVDLDGRKIGYDYATVAAMVTDRFPKSRVSASLLRTWYAYAMRVEGQRMPVRCRSRRLLARNYTRVLLMQTDKGGIGLSFNTIQRRVAKRFPDVEVRSKTSLSATISRLKQQYTFPPRPPFKVVSHV